MAEEETTETKNKAEEEQATETENKEEQSAALKNTVTIEEAGPCKKKVSVEIPEEAIKEATDEQYESLRKEALVPGFRKGRAPRRLLEKRFGKETTEQIKLKLLADASDSAVKDNELDILGEPDVDFEKIEMPDTGPLKFDFEVEVRPEFDLPPLEGIAVKKTKLKVADEQINKESERLQKWSGVWTPREAGEVELDDRIIADVVLKTEAVEEEEKLDNIEIHVKQNGFVGAIPVETLGELLAGAKAGDTRQTSVDVPKTYFKEEYRGKKVDVHIAVKDIKWLKPAPLNEDFLHRFGVEDETELREKIRDSLESRLEQQGQTEMTEQIYKYMLDNTNFDLPMDVVAEYSTTLLQRQYSNLLMQGLSREQIEEQMEQLQAGSEQRAKEQLKIFFIMDKIAEKLDIDVSEEEINGHIAQLAIQQGQRPERMREEMVRDGSMEQFRLQVRENKCVAKLLESAKITEIKPKKKTKKDNKTATAEEKQSKKTQKKSKNNKKTDE
jgi:trigger factor